jgi:integrase
MADDWDGSQPLRPDVSVSGTINRFRPQDVPDDIWHRLEDLVRTSVTRAGPERPFVADCQMTVMAQLAVWADRIGVSLDPEVLLRPETIDRFLLEGCTRLTEGSRLNYRTHLWKVGAAVLGNSLFPPKALPLKRSEVNAPYTDQEITGFVSWSRGLPTLHMRRNAQALLAIGLGTGPQSNEIMRLLGTDIHEEGGLVIADVIGKAARQVPVLEEWSEAVRDLARESGSRPFFAPERKRITRRDIIGFIERCSNEGPAVFNVQRLRITWIVHHLSAGTRMLFLEQMSGVGAAQLVKYLKFATLPVSVDPAPNEEVQRSNDTAVDLHRERQALGER